MKMYFSKTFLYLEKIFNELKLVITLLSGN